MSSRVPQRRRQWLDVVLRTRDRIQRKVPRVQAVVLLGFQDRQLTHRASWGR